MDPAPRFGVIFLGGPPSLHPTYCAPQFGSAKEPVNMAGMIAANVIRGDARIAHWEELGRTPAMILDVRDAAEIKSGSIPGAAHIPLDELRRR